MEFPVPSADGFIFTARAEGRWRRKGFRQRDPESAAASYVIDEVGRLAGTCSVLASASLERKANARLGRASDILRLGVRMQWARVQIDVEPEDQYNARIYMRSLADAKSEWQLRQMRIAQAVALRDLLREDPTLALAQLLLESPTKIDDHVISIIDAIGDQVAAYAPGAPWVKTARLLEKSFATLPLDAKRFIVDRICMVLTEFGASEEAQHIMRAHGYVGSRPSPSQPSETPGDLQRS